MLPFRSLLLSVGMLYLTAFTGCGEVQPLWKEGRKLDSLTLYFSEPVEFDISFTHPQPELATRLELTLTYDQGINRSQLPLFMTIEDEATHSVQEYSSNLVLKEGGQWRGVPNENEVDYTLTHVAIEELLLQTDHSYTLKIYANDEEAERIYGIIELVARLYPLANEEEEES